MLGVSLQRLCRGVLLLGGIGGSAAGCSAHPAIGGDEVPYVRGPVVDIVHHATASGMRVEAGPGSREPCGIVATVDGETRYYRRRGAEEMLRIGLSAVSVGDTVEVYVTGPVAESCPVQAYAHAVVLVR